MMSSRFRFALCGAFWMTAMAAGIGSARAADDKIDLKSGEVADLGSLYWVVNCRSTMTAPPTAEVLEGPPELTVTVRPQQVIARKYSCSKPVAGGELIVTAAKDIKARLQGKLYVRVKYPTKDAERQSAREIEYTLFP